MGIVRCVISQSGSARLLAGVTALLVMAFALNTLYAANSTTEDAATVSDPVSGSVTAEIMAINADADYGEYLAGECMTCHSMTKPDSNIPSIHGKDAIYLVEALIQYRDQTRDNETMRSVAGALGNEEIAALAAYFSQQ